MTDTHRKHTDEAEAAMAVALPALKPLLKQAGWSLAGSDAADPRGDNDGGFVWFLKRDDHEAEGSTLGLYRVDYGDGDEWSAEAYDDRTGHASSVQLEVCDSPTLTRKALTEALRDAGMLPPEA